MKSLLTYDKDTRAPSRPMPRNSVDCQIHLYDDPQKYPVRHENPVYPAPPEATFADSQRVHKALGVERAVLVQASIYKSDHSLLVDALKGAPKGKYRGVAIIDDNVSDVELRRLHDAGVRGARFNFWKRLGLGLDLKGFHKSLQRIQELGWVAKVFLTAEQMPELYDTFKSIRTPMVIDHMGRLEFAKGLAQPAAQLILKLLRQDNWWIMISNYDRWSSSTSNRWDDGAPFAQAFYQAAPDRCIWGTDWPHIDYPKQLIPNDGDLVEQLYRYLPDQQAIQKVLVDNPARLFAFEKAAIQAV